MAWIVSAKTRTENAYDVRKSRYPFCVAWTPLPVITWFLPFIGHTGLCSSDGAVHDFQGPYTIGVDNMAFGRPTKLWRCSPEKAMVLCSNIEPSDKWDRAIEDGDRAYQGMMHNLCCNNCHSHVARCLNLMRYEGKDDWNMVSVWFRLSLGSSYVSFGALVQTYLPFLIIVSLVVLASVFA